jgi:hypothetical protein
MRSFGGRACHANCGGDDTRNDLGAGPGAGKITGGEDTGTAKDIKSADKPSK